jgi:ferric-dicitrate binding protein FerR (iron transport regulator)
MLNKPGRTKRETVSTQSLTKKTTERSEYKFLLLPDSTQVWLNAASTLEFPQSFEDDKREVFLSGEAYFDVKHANKVPFIIHTGNISTTVLGTAFNIKAYPGRKNIIVSVSRGKVRVNYEDKEVATLTQGQQVKVSKQDSRLVEKKAAMSEAAAWQRGNMVYDDEPIEDIIADLERIYDVHIQVKDLAIQRLHVSTSFNREIGIEQALQVLCELTDTKLKQADGLFIIQ